ncbi:hypothetical protein LX32DRAFT_413881 [Colletotrichum zoysiae]|uniref:Uncharacterized protein n=1 Tax=Colletotrichum zoysiae TaxID=1216348 RepID=A0AAD9HHC3_9PEZI|nr:hypothetical protein LX32DRAFT_413881 [Colletotrichum zoysiae]
MDGMRLFLRPGKNRDFRRLTYIILRGLAPVWHAPVLAASGGVCAPALLKICCCLFLPGYLPGQWHVIRRVDRQSRHLHSARSGRQDGPTTAMQADGHIKRHLGSRRQVYVSSLYGVRGFKLGGGGDAMETMFDVTETAQHKSAHAQPACLDSLLLL